MSGKLKSFFNATVGQGDEIKTFLFTADGTAITQSGGALDVNIASSDISITVSEVDVYAEDSVHATGDIGTFMLAVRRDVAASGVSADGDYSSLNVDASGQLWVKDADVLAKLNAGLTVSATDLDIRNLVFATDKVDVTGSEVSLDAATLAALESITVSAIDLDIRSLAAATDSVAAWANDGAGNAIGSLGGALRVTDHADTIAQAAPVIADTATAIAAAATQSKIMVQNLDSKTIYIGNSGVTSGTGYPVDKNEFIELPFSGTLYAITASGSTAVGNVRVLQLSA